VSEDSKAASFEPRAASGRKEVASAKLQAIRLLRGIFVDNIIFPIKLTQSKRLAARSPKLTARSFLKKLVPALDKAGTPYTLKTQNNP